MERKYVDKVIAENADLQKKLNKDNSKYYDKLLLYVRLTSLTKNEEKIEEILLGILQDILEAQSDGIDAEVFFGKNPKEIADEILENVPNAGLAWLKFWGFAFGVYVFVRLFMSLVSVDGKIDLGNILISAVLSILLISVGFYVFGKSVYYYKSKFSDIIVWLIATLIFASFILLTAFIKTPFVVSTGGVLGIVLIIIIYGMSIYFYIKASNKEVWKPFVPMITGVAILGVVMRLPMFSKFFDTKTGIVTVGIVVGILWVVQIILNLLFVKKEEKMINNKLH